MAVRLLIAVLLFGVGWSVPACGQRYRFEGYLDGLDNLNVWAIVQDRTGYLWLGTENGIYRFDGARFRRFGRESGIEATYILALQIDSQDRLWAATSDGLFVSKDRDRFEAVANQNDRTWPIFGNSLTTVSDGTVLLSSRAGLLRAASKDGNSWFGAAGESLWGRALDGQKVYGVLAARDGGLYVGCGDGICRLQGNQLTRWGQRDGLPRDQWNRLYLDRSNRLWVRGRAHIAVHNPGSTRFTSFPLPFRDTGQSVPGFTEDAEGRILTACVSALLRFENGRWQVFSEKQGLTGDLIETVYVDRAGSVWLGISGRGLQRWSGYGEWENWTTSEGLGSNLVWATLRDKKGRLWVGDEAGLSLLDKGSSRFRMVSPKGVDASGVRSLAMTKDGTIWAGTIAGHLIRLDPETYAAHQYQLPKINRIFVDSRDHVLVATDGGLFRSERHGASDEPKRIENAAVGSDTIADFAEAVPGEIWIATSSTLVRWTGNEWRRFEVREALHGVLCEIAVAPDGSIWADGGFPGIVRMRLNGDKAPRVEAIAFTANDAGYFVRVDRRGDVWAGTDHGLVLIHGNEVQRFTGQAGLSGNDLNEQAFYEDVDGSIWVGSCDGLSHLFHPQKAAIERPHAPVFASARLGSQDLHEESNKLLPYVRSSLVLDLTSLNLISEKSTSFRYRLAGMESDWTRSTERQVRYSVLPPGKYKFEVFAESALTTLQSPLSTLTFEILPPWWSTWWFRSLAACFGASIVALGFYARERHSTRQRLGLERLVQKRTEQLNQKVEELKLLKDEADRANRSKSDFLAMMSHEIRTPMNGVVGMAALLLDEPRAPEHRDAVSTIKQSGDCLLTIINDILDFSKIEAGKLELESIAFELRPLVHDSAKVLAEAARQKDLPVKVDVDRDLPRMLTGDPIRLRQILLNLLSNAVKFTKQGQLAVRVDLVSRTDERILARFSVADTGIGISAEGKEKLFQSFSQAHTSIARNYGGTGLGLAISKRLVELMEGEIQVDSELGRGSTFSFTANLGMAADREQRGANSGPIVTRSSQILAGRRVLVAEDNLVNQKVARKMLERLGCQVDIANDGIRAIEMAVANQYCAILMDCQMPNMDGYEAAAAIRSLTGPNASVPIVALTANTLPGEEAKCRAAGMTDFLNKPVRPEALEEVLLRCALGPKQTEDRPVVVTG